MKPLQSFFFPFVILISLGLFSCVDETTKALEKQPYFDLKGFISEKIQEVDSVEVTKVSQVQDEVKQTNVVYSIKDWEEEFGIFTEADINKSSLLQSYETKSSDSSLTHELFPKAKAKVKYLRITYSDEAVSSVSIKVAEENLFYTSITLAELYLNNASNRIDHYSIETTQKIWFLEKNDMKIKGTIASKR